MLSNFFGALATHVKLLFSACSALKHTHTTTSTYAHISLVNANASGSDTPSPTTAALDADAQYRAGHALHHGEGVPQDFTEAMKCFRKAAAEGHAQAQYSIGHMYDKV